jgi:GAF domain-containing protein
MQSSFEIATLLDGFRMVGSIALADPKTRRDMTKEQAAFLTALASQVKVAHQDRWVRLRLDITPAMLGSSAAGPAGH